MIKYMDRRGVQFIYNFLSRNLLLYKSKLFKQIMVEVESLAQMTQKIIENA
jgi:hypothetical protein